MTTAPTLHAAPVAVRDRSKEQRVRAAQVMESFATGLCLRPVSVTLTEQGVAPAWSSATAIWFNEAQLGDLQDPLVALSLKGLTLHEIGHILLTPRSGSDLVQWVVETSLYKAFNALEDQRIESMLVAKYPSIRGWLTATIAHHLLSNKQSWSGAFPLIRGRKYLPVKVRRAVMDAYRDKRSIKELCDIIDQYRLLNLSDADDALKAQGLIERYAKLVRNGLAENPHGHDDRSVSERPSNPRSKALSDKEQERLKETLEQWADEDENDLESYDDEPSDYDDESESESGSESESYDGEQYDDTEPEPTDAGGWGDDETETEVTEGDADGEPTETDSADAVSGAGQEAAEPALSAGVESKLQELLQETFDQTFNRLGDDIQNDIDLFNGEVLMSGEQVPAPPVSGKVTERDAGLVARDGATQFAEQLLQLKADSDPAWSRRVADGRINAVRWERGCELEEAFDRWDEGNPATDIECVVLLDTSWSMTSEISGAYDSVWALKSALDSIHASTTVVTFSDDADASYLLYGADEEASNQVRDIGAHGGTNPRKALTYATSVLANSNRAIKIALFVTDGEWANEEKCDAAVRALRDSGVLTGLVYISPYRMSLDKVKSHGCEVISHIVETSDLFHLGQQLVERGIQRLL